MATEEQTQTQANQKPDDPQVSIENILEIVNKLHTTVNEAAGQLRRARSAGAALNQEPRHETSTTDPKKDLKKTSSAQIPDKKEDHRITKLQRNLRLLKEDVVKLQELRSEVAEEVSKHIAPLEGLLKKVAKEKSSTPQLTKGMQKDLEVINKKIFNLMYRVPLLPNNRRKPGGFDSEKAEQIVYISCVDEVRYSFVSHLSEAIRRKGINDLFEDSDDLLSEEAQEKVKRARVSVVVLPGNRKPSTGKLRKVLECQRNDDQVLIPVLYGVRIVEGEWLNVLKEITGLSPLHQSREECTDSVLVEEIARDVYDKLYHIGIYSKLLEIKKMVCNQPFGIIRNVGIWGMPGIGKTTLAKAVFVQMSGEFDACCFIKDFDKVIHKKGLYRLLEEQFLEEKPSDGGTMTKLSLLRDKLNSKKVLVVLDDVHNHLAAKSFLGGFDWFGPESLIIITSRDKQVFRLCQVDQIYEVHGLNEKEALQLFSLCASTNDMAEQNLGELSTKVIKYANGNPLALNVYGSELKGKKKLLEMETAFLELKRRPHFKIIDALKSSYDTLSDSEKNIFLDIACFFQGENVDYVMQLLEGCGFFPHDGIDVLVEKCLVTVSESRVRMHNLIQDAGREITVQMERRSRLWEPQSIKDLLEDNEHEANGEHKCAQGTEETEGMFLDTSKLSFDIKPAAFENMLNLRLLKIYCSNPEIRHVINFPEGLLHSLPNELRLLHWENYPLESLPQNFDPRNLVEINMPYSQLQKLWDGTKNLEMLRTIVLCHSQKLVDIKDLLNAPNLEVIDIQGCTRLQSFPATDQLRHLRVVNLSGCTKIESFPKIPPNTETLHLQGTGITELPLSIVKPNYGELLNLLNDIPGLSGVSNLKQNDLERLTSLMKMSSSSQDLGKLICLDLKDCSRLLSLPNMSNLEFLKVLDLSGCSNLETIQGFPQNLKELYIAGTAVREVPQLPRSLELLNAHDCISLKSIPLDSENLTMHYIFSNCFSVSPQVVNDFLVKVLGNIKHIPRELLEKLNETPVFSFCAPSHANQDFTLDLQLGSSVMRRLNPSLRNTLVGFAMLVEVSFSEDYCDATGFGISCVCRWKNKEGHSHKIERNLHCSRAPWKAVPKVQKDHLFVFCDIKMSPCTVEGNDADIWADLVVFEFFPVKQQTKRLDDSCTVIRCGVYAITGNTDLKMSSPVLSLDPMEVSGNEVEEALRVRYDGLEEMDKALFLYIASLFNDEDADLVAPLIASIDLDVSLGLSVLANSSLIRVSSNGEIVMPCLLRNMGKEILHRESVLPGSSKDFEEDSLASVSSRNGKYDVYLSSRGGGFRRDFRSDLIVALEHRLITTFKDSEIERGQPIISHCVQAIRESKIVIVVFSTNYASSSWLLDELVEIAQAYEEMSQIVRTFYYDVDPLDVRRQRGEFGRQFEQTCKNKTKDEKQRWCRALTTMANLVGLNSKNCQSDRGLIKLIVEDVYLSISEWKELHIRKLGRNCISGSLEGISYFRESPKLDLMPTKLPPPLMSREDLRVALAHHRRGEFNIRYPSATRNYSGGVMGSWHMDASLDEGFGSSLLEEFKSKKIRGLELSEIADYVVEFSLDQYGSRFIQQKLETATADEKNMVYEEIMPQALALMTDVFGNYVIQKFFVHGLPFQRRKLAEKLFDNVLALSLQMYGCRVIQKAIEVVDLDQKMKMLKELDGHVMRCVRDQNGNHVVQKCIECVPKENIEFIISAFVGQVVTLSTHPYGCRVIQRVLEHCHDPDTQSKVMEEILSTVSMLAQDQYGNYIVQQVLEHGKPDERTVIIKELAGKIVQMSQQKFASNVVEKCLTFGGPDERELLVNEMLGTTDENEPLQAMMKDQFANYVVQTVLETCDDQQRELILTRMKVHLNALKKYTYGKHIVARVEKLVAFGEGRMGLLL